MAANGARALSPSPFMRLARRRWIRVSFAWRMGEDKSRPPLRIWTSWFTDCLAAEFARAQMWIINGASVSAQAQVANTPTTCRIRNEHPQLSASSPRGKFWDFSVRAGNFGFHRPCIPMHARSPAPWDTQAGSLRANYATFAGTFLCELRGPLPRGAMHRPRPWPEGQKRVLVLVA